MSKLSNLIKKIFSLGLWQEPIPQFLLPTVAPTQEPVSVPTPVKLKEKQKKADKQKKKEMNAILLGKPVPAAPAAPPAEVNVQVPTIL